MKKLILKNLIAHRENNKQTAILYSLTVGTVIFLYITLAIQLQFIETLLNPYVEVDFVAQHK
jgi:hypothetical protein